MPETYNEDAVQQILKLAMVRQGQDVALPRYQLVEIAEDLGISESTLVAAEEEWQIQQEEEQARDSFEGYRHQQLQQGIVRFLIVNSGLVLLNVAVAHRINWSVYPVLIWGMAIALQAWQTFRTEGEEYDRAFRRWRLRQQIGQSFKAISERFKFFGLEDGSQPDNAPNNAPNDSAAANASDQSPFGSPQNVRNDRESNGFDDSNNGANGSTNSNGIKSAAGVDSGVAPNQSGSNQLVSNQFKEAIAKDETESVTIDSAAIASSSDSTSIHTSQKASQTPPADSDPSAARVDSEHESDRHP